MTDYENAVIYTITCKDEAITGMYVGSSKNFYERKRNHIKSVNNVKGTNRKRIHHFIRENGGWENFNMEILENYPCITEEELFIRERFWYDELKPDLNERRPYATKEEKKQISNERKKELWKSSEEYREKNKERRKEHYERNKADILMKKKLIQITNGDKIRERKKIYYERNRDVIVENARKYREENREKLKARAKELKTLKTQNELTTV